MLGHLAEDILPKDILPIDILPIDILPIDILPKRYLAEGSSTEKTFFLFSRKNNKN